MTRERTTWNRDEVAKRASLSKQADPYLMNQDHVNKQPSHDKYTIGGPSDFAEDVHPSKGTWEAEYANGQVKRNEIGMPEMRNDKTATEVEMVKKASLAVAVARAMLPKTAGNSAVEDQASRLMKMADEDLVETYKALVAGDDGESEQQEQEKQAQEQQDAQSQDEGQKQGGELPPALKKFNEEKAEKSEGKDDQGDKKAQDQQQADQDQGKQAQMDAQAQMQQMMAQMQQMQQMLAQLQGQPQQQQVMAQAQDDDKKDDKLPAFLKDKEAQEQEQEQQGQDKQATANLIQAAITAALASGQDPAAAAMRAAQGCMQQPMADDQLIDQMLSQQEPMMSDMGIEMDSPSMDTGDTMMSAQDDVLLAQIFATEETEQAQQAQGQKQAHAVRTAATRTVGTRPTQGVSGLGGLSGTKGESNLSSIWSSAPDVRDAFGIR